jgi:hypothetical protein
VVYSYQLNKSNKIALKAKDPSPPFRLGYLEKDFSTYVHEGAVSEVTVQTNDYRRTLLVGATLVGGFVVMLAALHLLLPEEYRACALMPGFCKKAASRQLQHFEKLDKGFGGGPKFNLSSSR